MSNSTKSIHGNHPGFPDSSIGVGLAVADLLPKRWYCTWCEREHSPDMSARQWELHELALGAEERARAETERVALRGRNRGILLGQGASRRALDQRCARWPAVIELVRATAEPGANLVMLAGGTGTGKTMAATHWLLAQPGQPHWTTARTLSKEPPWCLRWEMATNFVIDDLGTELPENAARLQGHLDDIVDQAYRRQGTVVITANMAKEQFRAAYGGRIASRWAEAGRWIALTGADQRGAI